jgi:TPR repeat protein
MAATLSARPVNSVVRFLLVSMTDVNNQALLNQAKVAIEIGNCEEAIPLLLPLAEGGDVEAQFLLGYMYFADCDYPFPDSVARDWLVKAKEQGHAEACYHLAWFPNAQGVSSIDDAEYMNLLIEAGERGSVEAQRDLGASFATGDWIGGKDEAKAVEWYTKAAEQGHALSQYDLGFMLLLGEGTAQDTLKGMEWLNQAGEQGNLSACGLLADIYSQGMFDVGIDVEKARYWEEMCSKKGEI